jgi:DNA-directed RNA polymerase specialized sigma24 family protein
MKSHEVPLASTLVQKHVTAILRAWRQGDREAPELRFFGGLTVAETASALGCSTATVSRQWRTARAWLFDQLSAGAG